MGETSVLRGSRHDSTVKGLMGPYRQTFHYSLPVMKAFDQMGDLTKYHSSTHRYIDKTAQGSL